MEMYPILTEYGEANKEPSTDYREFQVADITRETPELNYIVWISRSEQYHKKSTTIKLRAVVDESMAFRSDINLSFLIDETELESPIRIFDFYRFDNLPEIFRLFNSRPQIAYLLYITFPRLLAHFPNSIFSLSLKRDPEFNDEDLFVYIEVENYSEAVLDELNKFDQEWGYKMTKKSDGLLQFNFRFN